MNTLRARLEWATPLIASGIAGVLGGGVAAAVTGPTDWERGSWVAAYLVLVVGAGQLALGACQAILAREVPPTRLAWCEWLLFTLSSIGVITGTLVHRSWIVVVGTVILAVALVLFGVGAPLDSARHRTAANVYRIVLLILVVSAPIGVILSIVRE